MPLKREVVDDFAETTAYVDIMDRCKILRDKVAIILQEQGINSDGITFIETVDIHYDGTDSVFHLPITPGLKADFQAIHLRETSFSLDRKVLISGVRVQASGSPFSMTPPDFGPELAAIESAPRVAPPKPSSTQAAVFEVKGMVTSMETPVYTLSTLTPGATIDGPAILVDSTQTIVVEPQTRALVLKEHVVLKVAATTTALPDQAEGYVTDPIMLAVFANRFMTIAEQMGHTLQRTSVSVSIKERLDFSCSIHGTDGGELEFSMQQGRS